MKLTAKLALSQIKITRVRTFWTIMGIALSTAMITAVFGFAASGDLMLKELMGENEFYRGMYNTTLTGISIIFTTIIVAASVIVVSNAFRVSAGERISQFGILKSVGATRKQIMQTVIYEGVFLCVLGIPLGLALGIIVHLTGISIANHFLAEVNILNDGAFNLRFVFSWSVILLSVFVSLITVFISAWIPARKAAQTPAIDAIRGAGEVKINKKQVRGGKIIGKLFGFEGTLAAKSMKRSKRNFRATVISLTAGITLFIVVGDLGLQLTKLTNLFYPDIDANVIVHFYSQDHRVYESDGTTIIERLSTAINNEIADEFTDKMREYGAEVFSVGSDWNTYSAVIPTEEFSPKMIESMPWLNEDEITRSITRTSILLITTDPVNYAALCEKAGVPYGSNILINNIRQWNDDGGWEIFAPLIFDGQKTFNIINEFDDSSVDLTVHGELTELDIPAEIRSITHNVTVLVPQMDSISYTWFAQTKNSSDFEEFIYSLTEEKNDLGHFSVINLDGLKRVTRGIANLIMVFISGFVAMLTLIGLTNVISTISTNVRSRSREFAVLRSVGMTETGLKNMLNLESIICSVKSLLLGVPLGIIGSYLLYDALELPVEMAYALPFLPIILCTLGVFILTWGIMRYSSSRLRGGSIVDVIRSERGI